MKKVSSFYIYVIFGQNRKKLLSFLMESDSCTVMGQFKFLSRQDGVLAISQSL